MASPLERDLKALKEFIVAQRLHRAVLDANTGTDAASLRGPGHTDNTSSAAAINKEKTYSRGPTASTREAESNDLNIDWTPPAATHSDAVLDQLRAELTTATAELHAARAEAAQLRIQQRCDDATMRHLTRQVEDITKQLTDARAETVVVRQQCQKVEAAHEGCAERYGCVRDQVQFTQERLRGLEETHAELQRAAEESVEVAAQLTRENARLDIVLQSRSEELFKLTSVEVDLHTATERLAAFEQEHEEWLRTVHQTQAYIKVVQVDYVSGMQAVQAIQRRYAAVCAALHVSEASCLEWEALFQRTAMGGERRKDKVCCTCGLVVVPERDGDDHSSPTSPQTEANKEEEEEKSAPCVPQPSLSSTAHLSPIQAEEEEINADSPALMEDPTTARDSFVRHLEAKVADLALRLYDANTRATTAEAHYTKLVTLHFAELSVLIELKAMVCILRPEAEKLAALHADTQARLLVAESMTAPLLEHVLHLVEALTEEVCKSSCLEACGASVRGAVPTLVQEHVENRSSAAAGDGAVSPRAPTIAAVAPSPFIASKRQRLRAEAMLPNRHRHP